MKADMQAKALAVLVAVVVSMLGWYLVRLTDRIDGLTDEVRNLRIAVEVAAGGNPFSHGGD
ncbi:MAG: hypothetical protein JSV86_12875 [Gemmatimonadota bacterium]|nr:MAG: hypothetical protein JSV86_12875 [Gemmatimonadota bacterium]